MLVPNFQHKFFLSVFGSEMSPDGHKKRSVRLNFDIYIVVQIGHNIGGNFINNIWAVSGDFIVRNR